MDPHRLQRCLDAHLRCVELGHSGLEVGPLSGVEGGGGSVKPSDFDRFDPYQGIDVTTD